MAYLRFFAGVAFLRPLPFFFFFLSALEEDELLLLEEDDDPSLISFSALIFLRPRSFSPLPELDPELLSSDEDPLELDLFRFTFLCAADFDLSLLFEAPF